MPSLTVVIAQFVNTKHTDPAYIDMANNFKSRLTTFDNEVIIPSNKHFWLNFFRDILSGKFVYMHNKLTLISIIISRAKRYLPELMDKVMELHISKRSRWIYSIFYTNC